jgi:hypothetical protein
MVVPPICPGLTMSGGQPRSGPQMPFGQSSTTEVKLTMERNSASQPRQCRLGFNTIASGNAVVVLNQAASSAFNWADRLRPLLTLLQRWLAQLAGILGPLAMLLGIFGPLL